MSNDPQGSLSRFSQDVLRAALVDAVSKVLSALALALVGLAALLVITGGTIPSWVGALELGFVAFFAVLARRRGRRSAQLEPVANTVPALQEQNATLAYALDRHYVYAQHLAQMLDHLQRVVSGDLEIPLPDYIVRGILEPARDVLMDDPSEDVRLSVLLPTTDDDNCFVMVWAAGHNINSQAKYRVAIDKTLSRIALDSGELQTWDDVTTDDRFEANPHATRPMHAMVSIPLWQGDQVVGVCNTIASEPAVFDDAETSYLASLGGILSVAVAVWLEQNELPDSSPE